MPAVWLIKPGDVTTGRARSGADYNGKKNVSDIEAIAEARTREVEAIFTEAAAEARRQAEAHRELAELWPPLHSHSSSPPKLQPPASRVRVRVMLPDQELSGGGLRAVVRMAEVENEAEFEVARWDSPEDPVRFYKDALLAACVAMAPRLMRRAGLIAHATTTQPQPQPRAPACAKA